MAMVTVLLAIVLLTVYLTEVQQESATAFSAAIAERDRLRAEYHARSAINLARMLIATEPTVRKAIEPMFRLLMKGAKPPQIQIWEFSDQVLGLFNNAAGAEGFQALAGLDVGTGENLGLGDSGKFELVVIDEDSKLNVNTAARGDIISRTRLSQQLLGLLAPPQYNPLFEQPDADDQHSDRQAICGAIIDWADSDQDFEPCDPSSQAPVSGGSEDNYYQGLGLPYFRKNAAYDSLEELRLVRGMSDDFWATFVDPDPRDPKKRIMTVWGQGKINVNSANPQTLLALVCAGAVPETEICLDPIQAATFLTFVGLIRSFTAGAPLFGSSKDFVNTMKGAGMVGPFLVQAGITPVKFKSESEMRSMVTTSSKMFSIYAEGVVPGRHRETRVSIHAVLDFRNAKSLTQLAAAGGLGPGLPGYDGSLAPSAATSGDSSSSGVQSEEDMLAALNSNPGGAVVYWRVQ